MPFPTILINSATGSDSAASGAGPSTALTGSNASFSGAVVTLDGSPDLTNVATDGSHVLYLVTSTGVRFFKITAKDNGADTVTVTPNPAGTSTGLTWAIGGKRASLTSASSLLLVDNGGAAGDAKGGWAIEMESGHTETKSSRLELRSPGNTTDGPLIIRGTSGAGTRPILTLSGADIVMRDSHQLLKDFNIAGADSAATCIIDNAAKNCYERLKISGFSGFLFIGSGGGGLIQARVVGCELVGGSVAIEPSQNCRIIGNKIYDQTSHGIATPNITGLTGLTIGWNLIYNVGGDGIKLDQSRTDMMAGVTVCNNTIDDATGDGIEYIGDHDGLAGLSIFNNLITNCGGYGINFASLTANKVLARGAFISHNNTFNNTSGASNLSGVLENDPGENPDYVGGGDYTPTEATLEGAAFPEALGL